MENKLIERIYYYLKKFVNNNNLYNLDYFTSFYLTYDYYFKNYYEIKNNFFKRENIINEKSR